MHAMMLDGDRLKTGAELQEAILELARQRSADRLVDDPHPFACGVWQAMYDDLRRRCERAERHLAEVTDGHETIDALLEATTERS